jgi:uncharacterized protein (DUF2336 family)
MRRASKRQQQAEMGQNPGLDPHEALTILESRTHPDPTRSALAARLDAGADLLNYLARRGAKAIRAAVAANPAAPAAANRLLADDVEEDVRAELAAKIARLMPGLSERESGHVYALTVETLECLARDAAVKVRAILAEEIKALDCVPRAVVQALARDAHSIVAAPILEYSPLLSDADLMEIIACGQVNEALAAIASRKPVSEPLADRIVQTLDIAAIAALLVNPDAKIRKQTMDRIIEQGEEIASWHLPLALRADLSARAIRRIGGFVGAAIIERLAARNDLSEATRIHLNKELRARLAQTDIIIADPPGNAAQAVADARAAGKLDGVFVEQAAQAAQRELVVHALAALAHVDEKTVRKVLSAGNAKPLVSLVWHAHLSMRVAFKIQTQVMKLPGRGGVNFPLSKEEMRWHLAYFNIPA